MCVYVCRCLFSTLSVCLPAVPSVPKSFRIQQRHLDTIYVDWALPAEPNGVITGYTLKYQTGKRALCFTRRAENWANAAVTQDR